MAEEAKAMRVLVKRALVKIMNRQLAGAWDRWLEMVEEAADMRLKMRRCMNMMLNKAMAMGWRLWCEVGLNTLNAVVNHSLKHLLFV
jgi:hypothetical protein